ncbi:MULTISPECIES: DUF378 domain-containing protein [Romboutsia]|uniref:DUF378 domain-containing protein n=1 Tax=Romboutsia hominis TaxID=1507512 RepID=A0A2P2BNI9_9FIRM|nr:MULTISPECIES: DUF378 domain-containing protein [Romboutsia]MCH1959383.1 DUF378 domain-containing protein [Romboutsia hominis]MCH1970282.1 DUF378 domain-containing protein [Romboutsia hominis]MDB8790570.1 DUF378 domain-containing protein [Romboutsia sp. 1001216sp1]MDB8794705.1 DUF378 domain-containing protein [Romboutsia sp. 1001216sp1]MDB8797450.1 DUF378 domain-containing protein [Romboutsia sp. 1001216sp1]
MDMLYDIALILVIIGAINWGLVSIANFDLVAAICAGGGRFGNINTLSKIVYGLVGLSGIYIAIDYFMAMM